MPAFVQPISKAIAYACLPNEPAQRSPSLSRPPHDLRERLRSLASAPRTQLVLDQPCETGPGFNAFRRADGPFTAFKAQRATPSRVGLDTLQASGSSQFSPAAFHALVAALPAHCVVVDVDIRQESHGFDGPHAVGFWHGDNDGNDGLSPAQVLQREAGQLAQLDALPRGSALQARDIEGTGREVTLHAGPAYNEAAVVQNAHAKYLRIPSTDGAARPCDATDDLFVQTLRPLSEGCWAHFHCLHGHGRTTLYMAMYDMLRNAHQVGLHDIVDRQWLVGGIDLHEKCHATWAFLQDFHAYCREAHGKLDFAAWSDWRDTGAQRRIRSFGPTFWTTCLGGLREAVAACLCGCGHARA